MLYLYCFARPTRGTADRARRTLSDLRGIDEEPVDLIALPDTAEPLTVAYVSAVAVAPAVSAQRAVAHDSVCTAALQDECDVLPARFGQVMEDRAALVQDYLGRRTVLAPLWERVGHAVEMSLILTPVASETPSTSRDVRKAADAPASVSSTGGPPEKASSTGTGYAYLMRVAGPIRERRKVRELIEPFRIDLKRLSGELIRDEVVRSQATPPAISLSHLVDRNAVERYKELVARAMVAHPLIRVLLSGPHAPYSFVSLPSSDGRSAPA